MQANTNSPVSEKTLVQALGGFVQSTQLSDLPKSVVEQAKVSLLHNLAMAIAGRRAEQHSWRIARSLGNASHSATLLYDGSRVPIEGAVLANAALMHARGQDDTHTLSSTHPGCSIIPAAMALAESRNVRGSEFLAAVVAGYEVQGRVGRGHDTLTTPRGFRATMVFGVFGAAAASARVLGLSADSSASALAIAANLAGGLGRTFVDGTDEWTLQVGLAGRNGLLAAQIAEQGVRAAPGTLEGRSGFYQAFAGTTQKAKDVMSGLGDHWVLDEVTLKAYPVCAIHQSPVRLLLQIASEHRLTARDVDAIVLELNPYEAQFPGVNHCGPFRGFGATAMSGPFCLATALVDECVTLRAMFDFNRPEVLGLAARTRVIAAEDLPIQGCRVTVTTTSGEKFSRTTTDEPRPAKPGFEETGKWIKDMFQREGLVPDDADRLMQEVARIERNDSLIGLIECLCGTVLRE